MIIIAVQSNLIARLDTPDAADALPLTFPRHNRSVPDAIAFALKQKKTKFGAKVLVVSDEFFAQTVRLQSQQIMGLGEAELKSVLAFEVEPFSSIPVADALTAFSEKSSANGFVTYNVLQLAKHDARKIAKTVTAHRARLFGIAHTDTRFDTADKRHIQSELIAIENAAVETPPGIPLIVYGHENRARNLLIAVGAALTLVALSVCGYLYFDQRDELATLKATYEDLRSQQELNRGLKKSVDDLRKKIAALEKTADAPTDSATRTKIAKAWPVLFDALSASFADAAVIRTVTECAQYDIRVEAYAATNEGAEATMAKLAELTADAGWHIIPERIASVSGMPTRGPWRFTFRAMLEGNKKVPLPHHTDYWID